MPRQELKNLIVSLKRFKEYCSDREEIGYKPGIECIQGNTIIVTPECFHYFLRSFNNITFTDDTSGITEKYHYFTELNGYKIHALFPYPLIIPEKSKITTDLQGEATLYLKKVKGQ